MRSVTVFNSLLAINCKRSLTEDSDQIHRGVNTFKHRRLSRMYQNELEWLKHYFGSDSLSTTDYNRHNRRIYQHWQSKINRNKDRLIQRLEKCGDKLKSDELVEFTAGGFSDYDENKARQSLSEPIERSDDDLGLDVTSSYPIRPGRGRAKRDDSGNNEAGEQNDVLTEDESRLFDYDYSELHEATTMMRTGQVTGRTFGVRNAIKSIRGVMQGYAIWAKNHISNCQPKQPERQISRAAKWFQILAKKAINKSNHIQSARKNGLPILNS